MLPVTSVESRAVVLHADDIDTDQIIPARFLTTIERRGLGIHAFADWRYDEGGAPLTTHPLNAADAHERKFLVAGRNFGCGSSREHAPWALVDFGFRAIVAPSFADIFRGNALKNGLLPIELSVERHAHLVRLLAEHPRGLLLADLEGMTLTLPDRSQERFHLPPFARRCLLEGVDQMGYLLAASDEISSFEAAHHTMRSTVTT